MASTPEELESNIKQAISSGFRGRLLDRGLARSIIWKDGELLSDSPNFSSELSYDLLSYGYSLLGMGLRLREKGGDLEVCRMAFSKAASSIEYVVHNGSQSDLAYGFHNVITATACHLARYSAKAYSLLHDVHRIKNISRIEQGLRHIILRDFDMLESDIIEWKLNEYGEDKNLADIIDHEIERINIEENLHIQQEYSLESILLPVVDRAIIDNYYSALSLFLMALESGDEVYFHRSIATLRIGLDISDELSVVSQWWVYRVTIHLLDDLWDSSFHKTIPITSPDGNEEIWVSLRWYFILLLYKRKKAEIELWPSQIEGAKRAANRGDSLVVSLPTSAGKTRIGEICILRCLADKKRVLFVTPLRALSAQTEVSLRKTFVPLGKSVSTLYGSIGISSYEQDAIRNNDIVVGTPEKLDFALRNDPDLIDDVGLIVLDEGHMIGLSEREIRYEVQIQRLLKRPDANMRRIVCLSAILPTGDQLKDFVNWLSQDTAESAVTSEWRPTDLLFGELVWSNNSGVLNIKADQEQSFIRNFIQPSIPPLPNPGLRRTPFPKNANELSLATAWRLIEDNHTVLIYCPQKSSVRLMAELIVDLHKRGVLSSVLSVPEEKLELARILGLEWLGEGHPIMECLNIGVAVHHGSLPTPFRKEIEKLLRQNVLKLTISSPTLAQGLNLSATAIVVHSLYRSGSKIEASEFKNVIGRAGRAFVDIQGLVVHPMFDKINWRRKEWEELINDAKTRNMESGLFRLVFSLIRRIHESLGKPPLSDFIEYIANNVNVWDFPEISSENDQERTNQQYKWASYIASLDSAILSLVGENEVEVSGLPNILDDVLSSSLWQRRLARRSDEIQNLCNAILFQRAGYIWNCSSATQRKGYFLAGVGFETGQKLDAIAPEVNNFLISANAYIVHEKVEDAIGIITQLADKIFSIQPFTPEAFPYNWKDILEIWLKGEPIANIDNNLDINNALQFIEDGVVYRLSWGVDAIRVRAKANRDIIEEGTTIDDYETGLLVPALESGTLNRSSALLMQAGFNSRQAAIKAVTDCPAVFTCANELNVWLNSVEVTEKTRQGDWPTKETAALWSNFISEYVLNTDKIWDEKSIVLSVIWYSNQPDMESSFRLKIKNNKKGETMLIAENGDILGKTEQSIHLLNDGIYYSYATLNHPEIEVKYIGSGRMPFMFQNGLKN